MGTNATKLREKDLYNFEHRWKLRSWIKEEKLSLEDLIVNPNAMWLLEKNIDHEDFDWYNLNINPSAVYLFERNPDKIDWWLFSSNTSSTYHILKEINTLKYKILDKINWK